MTNKKRPTETQMENVWYKAVYKLELAETRNEKITQKEYKEINLLINKFENNQLRGVNINDLKERLNKLVDTRTIEKRLNITTETNGWENITTYTTSIGTFTIQRKDELNYYGNPVAIIIPLGYIESLPPIKHFRRNNEKQWYSTTSYDFNETMIQFLERLEEQLNKGERLYYNN